MHIHAGILGTSHFLYYKGHRGGSFPFPINQQAIIPGPTWSMRMARLAQENHPEYVLYNDTHVGFTKKKTKYFPVHTDYNTMI